MFKCALILVCPENISYFTAISFKQLFYLNPESLVTVNLRKHLF